MKKDKVHQGLLSEIEKSGKNYYPHEITTKDLNHLMKKSIKQEINIEEFIQIDRSVELHGNINALRKERSSTEKFFHAWMMIVGVLILCSLGSVLVLPLFAMIDGHGYAALGLGAFLYTPLIYEYTNRKGKHRYREDL